MTKILDEFLQGKGVDWDWDDFSYDKFDDKELDLIQSLCVDLPQIFPPRHEREYCNQAGMDLLKWLLRHLRASQ